ncbi:D-2-hydroxyacid dehydrogenase [Clostridium guangxiense]|uniref:D-2-hydroxyacid dehydrogenase n=1 Tax=Clostridium guangxiense TaxID=1662055 RepID=UPI001E42042A|nr:D-2-hydroxyacid dehydrogenase [Clostridium guangxiense]MCD2346628.1 D-2-hydroxyacid dehydrogenase [Clostridium guangxiense]
MKIVVLDGCTLNPGDLSWKGIEKFGEFTVYDRTDYTGKDKEKIIERAKGAEVIFTNKTPITKEIMDKLPELKYIGVLATGYNVVDLKAAREKGIVVTNIPAYGTQSVVQMSIALLLEICDGVGLHNKSVHDGEWENCADFCYWKKPIIELAGKTIGIVGYGSIGKAMAKAAEALGMKLLVFTPHPVYSLENDNMKFADLDTLFSKSDVISLHCPLFDGNKGMINKASISEMKDGVIIINTARGGLIVEKDLYEALESGKVYAAAVDVVSTEPINKDNPLRHAKNCIITPHIAWAAKEARQRLMDIAEDNFKKYIEGNPINVVNK